MIPESNKSSIISLLVLSEVLPTLFAISYCPENVSHFTGHRNGVIIRSTCPHSHISKGGMGSHTIKILQGLLMVFGLLALSFKRLGTTEAGSPYSFLESIIASIYMVSFMLTGILSSIFLYRISFFHRLYKFPGPFRAKISNLYLTKRSVASFQLYREIQDLHKNYGDIVRVGKWQRHLPIHIERF